MSFIEKVNEFFGVVPSDLIKRITVALVAMIIVFATDVLVLLGQGIGIVDQVPFLNDTVISVIIISSVMFSLSLVYFVLFAGRRKGKAEAYQ